MGLTAIIGQWYEVVKNEYAAQVGAPSAGHGIYFAYFFLATWDE